VVSFGLIVSFRVRDRVGVRDGVWGRYMCIGKGRVVGACVLSHGLKLSEHVAVLSQNSNRRHKCLAWVSLLIASDDINNFIAQLSAAFMTFWPGTIANLPYLDPKIRLFLEILTRSILDSSHSVFPSRSETYFAYSTRPTSNYHYFWGIGKRPVL